MKRFLLLCFAICILTALGSSQTNDLTYQGRLADGATAANGNYDFIFRLFDDPEDPVAPQIGTDQVRDDVSVTGGVFSVVLNFGTTAFDGGGQRYLEIYVRPGASTGVHTKLLPRQRVTSSPFSIKSSKADALSSSCVLCVTNAQIFSLDGSKVTGTVSNAATATTATNVSGVVPIGNGGTGSSVKNFVDLSSTQTIIGTKTFGHATFVNPFAAIQVQGDFNAGGVVSADQFYGGGDGLYNVAGTFQWRTVSALSQQAEPDYGYFATNEAQVTITLPKNIGFGQRVRVSGSGSGGWKVAQNDGQTIIGTNIGWSGANWLPREANRFWTGVASSADGTKLVAGVDRGQIYVSADSGMTWSPRGPVADWNSIASSADGSKLVAVTFPGQIYTSTDFGLTWTPRETERAWLQVASSADGNKLVATVSSGQIYTSVDSGITWTPREAARSWSDVASSANGAAVVAVVRGGQIFVSSDSGNFWFARENNRDWTAVASSSDGFKLIAAVNEGQLYISTNGGSTWRPTGPFARWSSVASSADGNNLVAVANNGHIYTSTDSGFSWTQRDSTRGWADVATSADGRRLVATTFGTQIYTSSPVTTIGTPGYLTGESMSAIELQYIGDGKFMPISYVGTIKSY